MSKLALISAAGLALVASSTASANVLKTYTGQGGVIPPSGSGGAGTAPLRSEIFVNENAPVKDVIVSLNNISHTWVGDLTVTLTHKDSGRQSILINRPGFPAGAAGDSSDLGGTYVFDDMSTGDLPAVAAALPATGIIPGGDYAPATPLAVFAGDNKFGTWSLEIQDAAGGDVGNLGSWTLGLFNVPTPGAVALFGLAGLAAGRRRR